MAKPPSFQHVLHDTRLRKGFSVQGLSARVGMPLPQFMRGRLGAVDPEMQI